MLSSLAPSRRLHSGTALAFAVKVSMAIRSLITGATHLATRIVADELHTKKSPPPPKTQHPNEPPIALLILRAGAGFAGLAGAWLILSPFVLPTNYPTAAAWNDVICGIVVLVLMGLKSAIWQWRWCTWVGIALGLWILFAPWILQHSNHDIALRNETVSAMAVILGSSISMMATMYGMGPPPLVEAERST